MPQKNDPARAPGNTDETEDVFTDAASDLEEHPYVPQDEEDPSGASPTLSDRRKSERKRPRINYSQSSRVSKKSRESEGSLREEDQSTGGDNFTKLYNLIEGLSNKMERKFDKHGKDLSRKIVKATSTIEESMTSIENKMGKITADVQSIDQRVKDQDRKIPALVEKAVEDRMADINTRIAAIEGKAN
jgi:hypothetical protein